MIRTNIDLLHHISSIELKYATIKKRTVMAKEIIVEQSTYISSVFILANGLAKCFLTEENGNDFVQEFYGIGTIFGEIEAIKRAKTFCSIASITEVEFYEVPTILFNELLLENKKFNSLIMNAIATKIQHKASRHSYHQLHATSQNIIQLKKEFPEVLDVIPKIDLANYLGITLRSLNRAIMELKNKNVL